MQLFRKKKEESKAKPAPEMTDSTTSSKIPTVQEPIAEPQASTSKPANLKPMPREAHNADDAPVLSPDDEHFFERLVSEDGYSDVEGNRPPLPERMRTPELSWDSDTESFIQNNTNQEAAADTSKGKGKEHEKHHHHDDNKPKRMSFLTRMVTTKKKANEKELKPTNLDVPHSEEEQEKKDMSKVLDDLSLAAKNNKAFSLNEQTAELMAKFTLVLKDLVNGVPTAADDLKALLEDRNGVLAKNYEKLPRSMKKLVTSLPNKLTSTLAPELLAVAAESQSMGKASAESSKGGLKSQAMNLLLPKNLAELVTKPSAIVGMLKAILNALKLRWPAFVGTSAIWSVAIMLLMFVLWYCYKRGRETRLEREASSDGHGRVLGELPDDPALEAGPSGTATAGPPASAGPTEK